MKKFIAFSGGVESTTMCVLFGKNADAIFADTGFEHREIYERIELVEQFCKVLHGEQFTIHRIKSKHGSLIDYIRETNFYPSFTTRYCTRMFKIEPIDEFLEQYKEEGCELMIGLNADEISQRTGNHGNNKFVKYTYPLADNGLTRANCIAILESTSLKPNFPPYMKRGGCIGCYYKSLKEYTAMALLNKEEFSIVEALESEIQDKRDKFYSIHKGKPMKWIRENAESMIFEASEMYPVVNDQTSCGVFCNR